MPFDRPDLDDLRSRIKHDIMARLKGTDALLRYNNLSIIGEVEAGTTHLLYGRLDWSFRQLFPDTAEDEFLERWANIWGVRRREATPARGFASWAAEPGTGIRTGAIVTRGDNTRYRVVAGRSVSLGEISVEVVAEVYGAGGNAATDVQLTLSATVTNVTPLGRVDEPGLAGGADREDDDQLLLRLLARIRRPPHAGTAHDYEQWAMEVPGVTRAWCFPIEQGPGTVVVRFMMDDVRAATYGIPEPGDVALVQAHIEEVRPVTAAVFVVAPLAEPLDVTIAQLEPDTPEVRAAIAAQLNAVLRREASPGGEVYQSQIFAAINAAPGVIRFRLVYPASDALTSPGRILILGDVIYV